jgi:hypothetical protein
MPSSFTDELIEWYWQQYSSLYPGCIDEGGICQCGSEKLIEHSDDPNQMRSFIMVAAFIDQMVYTHFYEVYPRFRERLRFPKLYSHPSIVGMASPSWLVYSYYDYDKKMDWEAARPIALLLLNGCLNFLSSESNGRELCKGFLDKAKEEIALEFEKGAAKELNVIMSEVENAND